MEQLPSLPLPSGARIPQLGFGTYKLTGQQGHDALSTALQLGHRHLDTAQMYGNEGLIGEVLAASDLPRSELFLTTKLNNGFHAPDDARTSFRQSLHELGTSYVDLFLVHWPVPERWPLAETWAVMEEFKDAGLARDIGVCNFHAEHFAEILPTARHLPALNQVELHPYFGNQEVVSLCAELGVTVEAWSPIARGACLADSVITDIAKRLAATPAQVVIAWHLRAGRVVIPKSTSQQRTMENLAALQVAPLLTEADIAALAGLDRGEAGRLGANPSDVITF
ncbi:aldo/keto reductase [Buchananella hordeovulneris]|uniref:NADP-dependent oxidoreductase domain-containing protein n=1 Tax=Buchananella hordeovulneris TaxID=52770 RepID=A0A1Q5PUY6_9ACTO|nr:aldo/keto reductase [Buchananella hordeovulneris]OKL51377.1 hypothetical protein BSZ40_07365 [Buchananella hordeovulneris]RRD44363.1 aldo/keto reductase [Buchananella hordeovulneris]